MAAAHLGFLLLGLFIVPFAAANLDFLECNRALNPCGVGACLEHLQGYSCICPFGFGAKGLNGPRCDKITFIRGSKTYFTTGGESCQLVELVYNLTKLEFKVLNPKVKCAGTLPAGQLLELGKANKNRCATFYSSPKGQSCAVTAALFSLSLPTFKRLNQGLDCNNVLTDRQVCVRLGNFKYPKCNRYYQVKAGDTCPSIMHKFNIPVMKFFTLNPALNCDKLGVMLGGFPVVCLNGTIM